MGAGNTRHNQEPKRDSGSRRDERDHRTQSMFNPYTPLNISMGKSIKNMQKSSSSKSVSGTTIRSKNHL